MAVCPRCGFISDSRRPLARLVDQVRLLDVELAKESLTQDQRIELLKQRGEVQMKKQKVGYQKSKARFNRRKGKKVKSAVIPDTPTVPENQEKEAKTKFLERLSGRGQEKDNSNY